MRQQLQLRVDGGVLSADRWDGDGPLVVLLHAGVADRRSWYAVADQLVGFSTVLAYDRRGFGDSPRTEQPFRHLDDLISLLAQVADEPVWLVGSSMGGQLALDVALTGPDQVAGLVLLAPAVSGAPEPEQLDPHTQHLSDLLDAGFAAGDLDEVNRLETWLWLDGPAGPEGRVSGPSRELALAMNAVILASEMSEDDGGNDLDTWAHVEEIQTRTTVVWGDLDVPFLVERCQELASRLPRATSHTLAGTAHLPYLERPRDVADIVHTAITTGPASD